MSGRWVDRAAFGLLVLLGMMAMSWLVTSCCSAVFGGPSSVGGRTKDGAELTCDLPGRDHIRNIGSKLDGAGMCVFSAIEMAARWQGLEEWRGFRDWCAANFPGGGYPQKVDKLLAAYAKAKGIAVPAYVQYEGPNVDEVVGAADRTGRMPCITYGYSPRYRGSIAHMTNCVRFAGKWSVCLDNNYPGEEAYEWMDPAEMTKRITHPNGSGWVFVWLGPCPPPVPHN